MSFEDKARCCLVSRATLPTPYFSTSLPQVDLRFLTLLTAIATQGAISRETQNGYYVKSYKLEVSTNGEDWMVYRHGKNHKVNPLPRLKACWDGTGGLGQEECQADPTRERRPGSSTEAQIIDGGLGDAGPENILYPKMIGKYQFSKSLAAVASCRAERGERWGGGRGREHAACSLTTNEGENVLPAHVAPHRIH